MSRWPSGLRRNPAKVEGVIPIGGSNPSLDFMTKLYVVTASFDDDEVFDNVQIAYTLDRNKAVSICKRAEEILHLLKEYNPKLAAFCRKDPTARFKPHTGALTDVDIKSIAEERETGKKWRKHFAEWKNQNEPKFDADGLKLKAQVEKYAEGNWEGGICVEERELV